MSSFDEHVQRTKNEAGEHNLDLAEKSRYEELLADEDALDEVIRKAVQSERSRWQTSEREHLNDQFKAGQLTLGTDFDAMVPLGESRFVRLGDMNQIRIQQRKDLRTKKHIDENRAFDNEMSFWLGVEALLEPGGTVSTIPLS